MKKKNRRENKVFINDDSVDRGMICFSSATTWENVSHQKVSFAIDDKF